MSLNRTQAPLQANIDRLVIREPQFLHLSNGIPMVLFNTGAQNVVMIKCLFPAGNWHEPKNQVASLTNRLMREGTTHLTAEQIANQVEYYGATLQTNAKYNHGEVTLYTLTKHLEPLLQTLKEVLTNATFPERELKTLAQQSIQRLLINREKIEYLADEQCSEHIWGTEHPYGYRTTAEDLEAINIIDLQSFYATNYSADNCLLYIAGKLDDTHLQLIEQYLGGYDWANGNRVADITHPYALPTPQKIHLPKHGSLQAAVRITCPMFNKTHPDYHGMFVVNTILGGFFGSRLMSNIREEKGYTYGIYSYIESLLHGGQFTISTEVGKDVREDAVKEIYKEITTLQTKLVKNDELTLVRNYLLGTLLSQMSSTFKLASTLQGIYVYGLDLDFYHKFVQTIQTITPKQIRTLAQKYLQPAQMSEIIVGI